MAVVLVLLLSLVGTSTGRSDQLQLLTRDQIISRAKEIASYEWSVGAANTKASCAAHYRSRFHSGEHVIGLPYGWGKMDDIPNFEKNIRLGFAAGAHKQDGVLSCATGIDCSGFVAYCWAQPTIHKYGTATIREIAGRPRYNWYTDMRAGDALVKPGDHIVLFAGYRADGNPNVYEASGSHGRVIFNTNSTWARFQGYYALQYRMVQER
jgi:cell wall-associated NlpC family hydrolase